MKRLAFSALFLLPAALPVDSLAGLEIEGSPKSGGWTRTPTWARADSRQQEEPPKATNRERRLPQSIQSQARITPFVPGSNNLSLDVGQVFLMGELADRYADSIGTRLHYTYGVSDLFSFDSTFGYSSHSDGEFSMTSLLAGLRSNLAWYDKVIPHAVFGMGFYRPSFKQEDYSTVLFGVHLGAGVNLELTPALFFGASLTFHDTFGSDRQTPSGVLPLGGSFTSFLLNAGVSF